MSCRAMRTVVAVLMLSGLVAGTAWLAPATAQASPALILNEYNCVGSSDLLDGGSSDTFFGRITGNGGNWIELVVVGDHSDLRGYELLWWEIASDGTETSVWDPTRLGGNAQGKIVFADAALWSDLRSGTIITIREDQTYLNALGASVDLSTDTSYNPAGGDWWIHVSSLQEAGQTNPLVTTLTNVSGDDPGAFSVGNNNWEMRITDGTTTVFGPIGEDKTICSWGGGGINSKEVGKLEANPSASITASNFKDGTSSTFGAPNIWGSGANVQDFSGLRVPEPATLVMLAALAAFGLMRRR